MAKKWELSKGTINKLEGAREALDLNLQELQEKYDNENESWQDSDRGQEISEFLEDLNNVFDALESMETEA